MNWILKVSTFCLLAANLVYPLTQGEPDGSGGRKEGPRVVKNQEALAIAVVAEAEAPTGASGALRCLKIGGMGNERKIEALAMLGQLGQARIFEDGKLWDVRFGPWPRDELSPLQDLLAKWGGANAVPCSNKEKEEWEKLK